MSQIDIEGWRKINSSKSASMFSLPPTIRSLNLSCHSPSRLTFASASFSGTFPSVVSKLGFAQNSQCAFWLCSCLQMLSHVTLFCPLAWRVSHWRTVLSLTSRAAFLPAWLALTFHSPWLMCLFFLFFPFLSFPAVVYFYLWSDIEARGSAQRRCSAPDLSLAQL